MDFKSTTVNKIHKTDKQHRSATEFGNNSTKNDLSQTSDYDYEKYKSDYYQADELQNTTGIPLDDYETDAGSESTTELSLNKTKQTSDSSSNVPMDNYCSVILLFRIRVRIQWDQNK